MGTAFSHSIRWIAALAVALLASAAQAASITVGGSTDDWWDIGYSLATPPDYGNDQQTGQHDSDIVGSDSIPALYTAFDTAGTPSTTDGTIGFRVRLGGSKKGVFEHVFLIGIDADIDGALDLFLGVNNSGSTAEIGIWDAGTGGTNTSPSTTTIVSTPIQSWTEIAGSNYDYAPVDASNDPGALGNYDVDSDGDNDYFLSFTIDFQALVDALLLQGIGFDEDSPYNVVAATSNQINALNNDLGGPDGELNSPSSWADLGALSDQMSANAIPEPETAALIGLGLVLLTAARRR